MVILEFSQSTNMDSVSLEMRENLDQIESYWDDSIGSPIIMKLNPSMMPVMIAAVEQDDMDSVEITSLVNDELLSELESLEGVASVNTSGEVEESVQVIIREDKIKSMNNKIADALGVSFADAREEMADAESELDNAQAELDSGKAQMESGKTAMASQLSGAKSQLQSKQMDVLKSEVDLDNKLAQIEESEAELIKSEQELAKQEQQLLEAEQAKTTLPQKLSELNAQKAQLEAGIASLEALKNSEEYKGYLKLKEQLSQAEAAGDQETAEYLRAQIEAAEAEMATQLGSLGLTSYTEEAIDAAITQLNANLDLVNSGIAQVEAAQAQLPDDQTIADGKAQIADGKAQIAAGKAQLASAKNQINRDRKSVV